MVKKAKLLAATLFSVILVAPASAAGFWDTFKNFFNEGYNAVKNVILAIAVLVGIILALNGVVSLRKSKQEGGDQVIAVIKLVAGLVCIAFGAILLASGLLPDSTIYNDTNLGW